MLDEEELQFPKGLRLTVDTGYMGYNPEGVHIIRPYKATKKKPITEMQKQINRWIASKRVVIEHAIGRTKIYNIVRQKIRHYSYKKRDEIVLICAGLANFKFAKC